MASTASTAYNVILDPSLNDELSKVASELKITKEEAVRRALELLKYAAKAENVELTYSSGRKRAIRLK